MKRLEGLFLSNLKEITMESREAVLNALQEGKKLTSSVTELQYMLIEGKLHSRRGERSDWQLSGLDFDNPVSWLNLRD